MQEVLARHGHRELQQVLVVYQTTRGIGRRNPTRGTQLVNNLARRGVVNRNLPGTKERLNFVSTHKTLLFGINVSEGSDEVSWAVCSLDAPTPVPVVYDLDQLVPG